MDSRMRDALDRHITGNWGEDQFREYPDQDEQVNCTRCGLEVFPEEKCMCSYLSWEPSADENGIWIGREGNPRRDDYGTIKERQNEAGETL